MLAFRHRRETDAGRGGLHNTVGRRGFAPTLACLTVLASMSGVIPQPVSAAAPVRECGELVSQLAFNITTRTVTCTEARRVVRGWGGRGNVAVRGLKCRYRDTGYEAGDIRCTGSRGRVVRWQTGA